MFVYISEPVVSNQLGAMHAEQRQSYGYGQSWASDFEHDDTIEQITPGPNIDSSWGLSSVATLKRMAWQCLVGYVAKI